MKIKWILFCLLICVLGVKNVNALDYYIDEYNVEIEVLKNNSYNIKEEISVFFNTDKHGIYRYIPMHNEVIRTDGTSSRNNVLISNVEVNEKYTTKISDGYYQLIIGDANTYVRGAKNYLIEYNYNIGKDPLKDIDEFYYNIIGTKWDTTINRVNFTITMPEEFDASLLGFSTGSYGSATNKVIYNVNGNVISGYTTEALSAFEGLTVRLSLPEGYFSEAINIYNTNTILSFVIPIILVLLALLLYYFLALRHLVKPVELNPPDNLSSLEIAFLYKGEVNDKDIISLLIYLANEKYIKLIEEENALSVVKLREYDKDDSAIKEFMRGLFIYGDKVDIEDLKYSFYKTTSIIKTITNTKENIARIIKEDNGFYKGIFGLMAVLCVLSAVYLQIKDFHPTPILMLIAFCMSLVVLIPLYYAAKHIKSDFLKFLDILFVFGFAVFIIWFSLKDFVVSRQVFIVNMIVSFICMIVILLLNKDFLSRTSYGKEMYGKILGFKKYISLVEVSELEKIVLEHPNYYYDILPYAYVLGISDIWIKRFEHIILEPTYWFESHEGFNIAFFNQSINSTINDLSRPPKMLRTMVMHGGPSSSNDNNDFFDGSSFGGSSGGGFSGGGSGGGGGGAW